MTLGTHAGPQRDAEIEKLKRWIEYAEILGAPVIRVFAGSRHAPQSDQETHELIVSAMADVL